MPAAAARACTCATLHSGSASHLEDWLRLQRCSGISHVGLQDFRADGGNNFNVTGALSAAARQRIPHAVRCFKFVRKFLQ